MIHFFCSMLVVGCTKARFTLLYKRKIDLPVLCLTAQFPPKIDGNYLAKKLFYYLFFGVWFEKIFFSRKSSGNGPKNGSNFAKIVSRKYYLIICFLAVFPKHFLKEIGSTSDQFFCSETPEKRVQKDQKSKYFPAKPTKNKKNKNYLFVLFDVGCRLHQNAFCTTIQAGAGGQAKRRHTKSPKTPNKPWHRGGMRREKEGRQRQRNQ